MKKEIIDVWIKIKLLRSKPRDNKKIESIINSAKIDVNVVKNIPLNENSATLIFKGIYDAIRQLGEARWLVLGYEVQSAPGSHEITMESLKEMNIKEKLKLNNLDRFVKIRNDANYRGFRVLLSQAEEILDFWDKCGEEITKILKKEINI